MLYLYRTTNIRKVDSLLINIYTIIKLLQQNLKYKITPNLKLSNKVSMQLLLFSEFPQCRMMVAAYSRLCSEVGAETPYSKDYP